MDSVEVERASLERDLEQINREIRRAQEHLAELGQSSKTKPELYAAEVALSRQLQTRRGYIEANLQRVKALRPGGLPSSQAGTWNPLVLHDPLPTAPLLDEHLPVPTPVIQPSGKDLETARHLEWVSKAIAGVVRANDREKRAAKELHHFITLARDDVPTLRLIAAAFDGINRSGYATELRMRIAQLTGAPEAIHPPAAPVVVTPLEPMPSPELLPDARDGLTRSQRLVLTVMHGLWFRADGAPKKTALLVEELRLIDPSMTAAVVEETLAQLTHPWSRRNPLIEVIGPACRLKPLAEELFADLDRDTVDFEPGFTFKIPRVLPGPVPMLLAKGTEGIPPHSLRELIAAALLRLAFPGCLSTTLLDVLRGPDLPAGGVLPHFPSTLYAQGRGKVEVRAKLEQQVEGVRVRWVATELPWPLRAAEVVTSLGPIEGVTRVRDESTVEAERVVIEVEHAAHSANVLAALNASPTLKRVLDVELRINDDGRAVAVTLGQALDRFLDHRREVVCRRARFELARHQERAEEIEGLLVAAELLESVTSVLDEADSEPQRFFGLKHLASPELKSEPVFARLLGIEREKLRTTAAGLNARVRAEEPRQPEATSHGYELGFSATQARALLKTRRLNALPRESLFREWLILAGEMAALRAPLEDKAALDALLHRELMEAKERFSSARRTVVAGSWR